MSGASNQTFISNSIPVVVNAPSAVVSTATILTSSSMLASPATPLRGHTLEKRYWSPKRMMEVADAKRKRIDFHSAQLSELIAADICELRDIAQENVDFSKQTMQQIYLALFEWIRHNGVPAFDVRARVTHAQRMQFAAGFGVYLAEADSELYELGSLASMSIVRACDQWIENHRMKLDALDDAGIPAERTVATAAVRAGTLRESKKARSENFERDDN